MSFEGFQLLDDRSIDTSTVKRDFMKMYHQQGAPLNDSNKVLISFSEKNNYHQIGNGHLEFDITLRKNVSNFNNVDGADKFDEPIGLVIIAFAYVFSLTII